MATAVQLTRVDVAYFWRRLPVIAYEDIGLGDLRACHDILKTFRRHALHKELGVEPLASYFSERLSRAIKSRALCDAIVAMEYSIHREDFEKRCFSLSDRQLISLACESTASVMDRIAALRHICGYRDLSQGGYRTLAAARKDLMREVCSSLGLTEIETSLFFGGQGTSQFLNIPLPLVAQMLKHVKPSLSTSNYAFEGSRGILFAALDKHTRLGKQCLSRVAVEDTQLHEFFTRRPDLNPAQVVGHAVFLAEGGCLDRQLVFEGADKLTQQANQSFMENVGVNPGDVDELVQLIAVALPTLNQIRTALLSCGRHALDSLL